MGEIRTKAVLTCPECGEKQVLTMPTDSCQYFYKCVYCSKLLKPKKGDCCVFCSFADSKCPPKQIEAYWLDELSKIYNVDYGRCS